MTPFSRSEALALFSRLVAGWAAHRDTSGARLLIDGQHNREDAGGSYEGVTRMLWGLGGWLSQPERPTILVWRGVSYDIAALLRQALVAGTDPNSAGYWGHTAVRGEYDQRTVESGQGAYAAWQSRGYFWQRMSTTEQAHLVAWLERFGRQPAAWQSNWALFWALNHAGRKGLGVSYDQPTIDSALEYLEGVICDDGWYDDAPQRGEQKFDDYNWWVFTTHELAWADCDGAAQPQRYTRLIERIRLRLAHFPYLFAADGAYSEYGRSLAYKFARLAAPLWAYRHGAWPYSAGILRRLVGRHLRWYFDRGAVRADGTLRQALTDQGSVAVIEPYISTGAVYWGMLAFGALWSLADDDPFWQAEEEPLPAEQGDFVRPIATPGWLLVGSHGAVQRFNAGSSGYYPSKYEKFLYATLAPFNVALADGAPSPDSMLCLSDGRTLGHRSGTSASAVGMGWLRMRYTQHVGTGTHHIDTTIVVRGEYHLRAHRITLDRLSSAIGAIEGSAPLGFSAGDTPLVRGDVAAGWEAAAVAGRAVAIARLRGYDHQHQAAAWRGRHDLNAVYGDYLLPRIAVEQLHDGHELICLVYTGHAAGFDPTRLPQQVVSAAWQADGTFDVVWIDGHVDVVPPLGNA